MDQHGDRQPVKPPVVIRSVDFFHQPIKNTHLIHRCVLELIQLPSRQFLSQAGAAATPMTIRPSSRAPPASRQDHQSCMPNIRRLPNKHRQVRPGSWPLEIRGACLLGPICHRMVDHLHDHFGPSVGNERPLYLESIVCGEARCTNVSSRIASQSSVRTHWTIKCVLLRKTVVLITIFFQRQIKISQPRRQVKKIFIGPQLMQTGIVFRPSQPRKIATPQKCPAIHAQHTGGHITFGTQ